MPYRWANYPGRRNDQQHDQSRALRATVQSVSRRQPSPVGRFAHCRPTSLGAHSACPASLRMRVHARCWISASPVASFSVGGNLMQESVLPQPEIHVNLRDNRHGTPVQQRRPVKPALDRFHRASHQQWMTAEHLQPADRSVLADDGSETDQATDASLPCKRGINGRDATK